MKYLLRNYAHSTYIYSKISELTSVLQSHYEKENEFGKQINDSIERCGKLYYAEEVRMLLIDGLEPTLRTIVAHERESHHRCTYLDIVQYARAEGEAVRACSHPAKMSANTSRVVPVDMIQSPSDSALHSHNEDPLYGGGVSLLREGAE